ncbi:MAG TPA: glycosyl transferase family 1, partial [Gammaproteobacteria bacterium]|nr:glycosyl transferase family 1 [Gammaproteobacteria bacterium]
MISTPYSYARELLAEGRGVLVPWPAEDAQGIERAVVDLLDDEPALAALRRRAAAHGRDMLWPAVARSYVRCFERALVEHGDRLRTAFHAKTLAERPLGLPELNLAHLRSLSDSTGILQHAVFSVPCYEDGYCVDDNARALLLTALLEEAGSEDVQGVRSLGSRYMAFVRHAFDAASGRFRNFMSYSRQWVDGPGSEDSHGRALWGLGTVVGHCEDAGRRGLAESLFHAALPAVGDFTSPRAWAYALLGVDEYLRAFQGESKIQAVRTYLAGRLFDLYRRTSRPEWPWFEQRATYCNARLSQALLVSGWRMDHEEMTAAGLRSLAWLVEVQLSPSGEGYFAPVGSNGFY